MQFRTEINIPLFPDKISYNDTIFGLGSCFVDNMKQKLTYYQFRNQINPFGTIFNPASIMNIMQRIVERDYFNENDLFYHQDVWKSFELHSGFNHTDKNALLTTVNNQIEESANYLKSSNWLFLTFGTAWVYKHLESDKIVSNCHKVPQPNFEKLLLYPEEISEAIKETIKLAKFLNPQLKILLSISPVRHLKDGFVENQHSKAHLLTAVHQNVSKDIYYFPSYEIMLDDLRDYRFYKDDFTHPNDLAINYIWEKFKTGLIDSKAYQTMQKVAKIRQGLQHKSFNPGSRQDINRLNRLQQEIHYLTKEFDWMQF